MTTPIEVERMGVQVGELIADPSRRAGRAVDCAKYIGRIVDFACEVLHVATPYPKQIAVLESFVAEPQTAVHGGLGVGKDFVVCDLRAL